jgi:hypothetical protein
MPERHRRGDPLRHIPEWAKKERASDMAWIQENLHVFVPAAQQGFADAGRGALVIDTTTLVRHEKGMSHPFVYLPEKAIEEQETFFDALRMVRAYDPSWEIVSVLLKPQNRVSTYQIGVPSLKPGEPR